jgi:hypothetical protein
MSPAKAPSRGSKFSGIAADIATPPEVADALGITVAALTQLRYRRTGPPYTRLGTRIRYRWSDVARYLDAQTIEPPRRPT